MWERIKYRIGVVALAIAMVYFLAVVFMGSISSYGEDLAETPGVSVLWGFEWVASYAGWIAVAITVLAFLILMAWQINKDRRGRG